MPKDAADKAIDDLLDGTEDGSGNGIPTTSDPDAQQRAEALKDAREAVDDAIQDLIDENEASDADPHDKQVREDALRDAQDAADDAIGDLIKRTGGDSALDEVRQDALDDAHGAVDDALGDLNSEGSEVRQDALDDARTAADDVIDELKNEAPDRGLDTAQEIHADALGDAKRELSAEFGRLTNETLADTTLSDADKLARVDALNDAKNAALAAVDDAIKSDAAQGRSELSRFLSTPTGGQTGGQTGGTSGTGGGVSGVQLGTASGGGGGGGQSSDGGSGAPMKLDATSMPANHGMPMAPPMGGMGAAGQPQRERDRANWLEGDAEVWADDDEWSSRAIGRHPSSS